MTTLLKRKHVLAATSKVASIPYSQLIIADGASSYWPLDDPSGTTARDVIGTRHGVISGGVTLNQPGVTANSKSMFIPQAGQILPPSFPPLNNIFTLEIWVKLPAVNGTSAIFLSQVITTDGDFQWRNDPTNTQIAFQYFSTSHQTFSWPSPLVPGQWTHLVITGSTQEILYANGVAVATNPLSASGAGPGLPGIGCAKDTVTQGAQSFMQDVAIYQKVLTPAQILAHYKNRVP